MRPEKAVLRPIEGLTKDLAMRALDKLKLHQTNQVYSLPDAQRLERGLLFGGRVRCGVCKRGTRVHASPFRVGFMLDAITGPFLKTSQASVC